MFTAVFDLDGTLADTSGDLLAAANAVFLENGYEAPLKREDRKTALLGGRAMLTLGAKRLEIDDLDRIVDAGYEPLLTHYRENLAIHTRLYPNTKDVIQRLKADGWKVAVCTNKPIFLAEPLLEELGIASMIDAVIGARSLPVSKPHPDPFFETIRIAGTLPENSVMIGDTATDYHTAKAAGAPILLVDFDETKIGDEFPDAPLVRDFLELEAWLQNWRKSRA